MFISRGEVTGGGKLRQLFWELEMNRMGGKDTVFGAAWRRGSGGFAGAPERPQVQSAAVVEAALRATVAPRGEAVGLRQEEGRTAQGATVQEGEASVPQEFPQVGRRTQGRNGFGGTRGFVRGGGRGLVLWSGWWWR